MIADFARVANGKLDVNEETKEDWFVAFTVRHGAPS